LTPDELRESASKLTGLNDFGLDDFADGLEVLTASFSRDAGLTETGRKAARAMVRGALIARLLSEAGFAGQAELPDIRRPVFVTGLPRTGTTFLHRLLVADPGAQGLELWLAEAPQPRPPQAEWDENLAYQFVKKGLERHQATWPEFSGVHAMGAGQVEECWQLLRQSMRSVSFECLAHLPSYSEWLRGIDWTAAYQRHKRNLQLIGGNDPDRRWVLKNPSHLFALDALLAVYPDALIVVTHRDPRIAVASMCSLAAQASRGWSTVFGDEVIGASQLALWSRGWATFCATRSRYPAGHFCDIEYSDLVADPLGAAGLVYDRAGVSLTGAAADAMRSLVPSADGVGSGSSGGGHRYALADFGLVPSQVDEAFPLP
jgi:hypothetical protein